MRLNQLVLLVFRSAIHCDFFLDSLVGHGGLSSGDRAVPRLSYDGILVNGLQTSLRLKLLLALIT